MVLVWDKTLFDEMYSAVLWTHGVRGSPKVPSAAGYYWIGKKASAERQIAVMLAKPGFASLSDIAIIGGGYGWTAEILIAAGINAISVDTSPHILATQATSEETEIRDALTARGFDPDNLPTLMDPDDPNAVFTGDPFSIWLRTDGKRTSIAVVGEDMANNGSRNKVKQALPGNLDGILTEYALDSMETDAESLELIERCEQLRPNPAAQVVHLISEGVGDLRLNTKTQAEWRTLLDDNGFNDHFVAKSNGVWI